MNVKLVVLGDAPPGLAEMVLSALPSPFSGGEVAHRVVDLERAFDHTRARADAERLLAQLEVPETGWAVLGITGLDLFLPALAYVFGVSALGERRGVVSWARLRSETESGAAAGVLARRLTTEAAHELGHALGLVHCVVPDCAMHRSLWPEQVDLKRPEYCPACQAALWAAVQSEEFKVHNEPENLS